MTSRSFHATKRKQARLLSAALLIGLALISPFPATITNAASTSGKPQPPVMVSIEPVQVSVKPGSLKPGDTVDLRIRAEAFAAGDEMRLAAELLDGIEYSAGTLTWSGPVMKKEAKELLITVRVPETGFGRISVTAKLLKSGATIAYQKMQLRLGSDAAAAKVKTGRPVKKDGKGRKITEY